MKTPGKFIVIEGVDGSGKSEQAKRLIERLKALGYTVDTYDFPQYDRPSSYFVRQHLNGKYGSSGDVPPKLASLFYALDRFDVGKDITKALGAGHIVISNRYVGSNMGHQGGKLRNTKERRKLWQWLYDLEYGLLGSPKPDINLVLHVPAPLAQKLVDRKRRRKYLASGKRDIYEADLGHLKRAESSYLEMVKLFPREFKLVSCFEKGKLLSIDAIHERVWGIVRKVLPSR